MSTATKTKQFNVGLPEPLYRNVRALADATHRTLVGTIAWLYAEQMEREGTVTATARDDGKDTPQVQPANS